MILTESVKWEMDEIFYGKNINYGGVQEETPTTP